MGEERVLELETNLPGRPERERVPEWVGDTLLPLLADELRDVKLMLQELTIANLDAYYEKEKDSGDVDTEFTITHNLGRIPKIVVINVSKAGAVVRDSRRVDWTTTQLFLECNVANTLVTVLVL
jgi:hypothetical protein